MEATIRPVNVIDSFVANYDDTCAERIRFAWNGKHADSFEDANYEFRKSVIERVLVDLDAAPLPLVRDLFTAETELSREAWCIDERVAQLAENLLVRGGTEMLFNFLRGKSQSFDASMCCGTVKLPPELSRALLAFVESQLAASPSDADRALLELGQRQFASAQPE